MADSNVEIYTLQIKRICQALRNLDDGIVHSKTFRSEHALDDKILDAKQRPDGFTSSDYDTNQMQIDIRNLIKKYESMIVKYEAYDQKVLDPLDMLGKKFDVIGTPLRVK